MEDIGPLAFTVPYLVPMLENAGANVFLARERDFQTNEVIVDNDLQENWPIQINDLYTNESVVADLDQDGENEIIVKTLNKLFVLGGNGKRSSIILLPIKILAPVLNAF